jgi:methionyl-tRNA formyltransferase
VNTLDLICNEKVNPQKQVTTPILKPAPKLFRENCKIDLNRPAQEVHNQIRGLSPYPAAWLTLKHSTSDTVKTLKIFNTLVHDEQSQLTGKFQKEGKQLFLPLNGGRLEILTLQLEGKKRMSAQDFLLGFPIEEWSVELS